MGLYLAIFDDGVDIDGIEIGPYEDFGHFRDFIKHTFEGGIEGASYPTLMLHSDCDGCWTSQECAALLGELEKLEGGMKAVPPPGFPSEWQRDLARRNGLPANSAFDCFVDVDG